MHAACGMISAHVQFLRSPQPHFYSWHYSFLKSISIRFPTPSFPLNHVVLYLVSSSFHLKSYNSPSLLKPYYSKPCQTRFGALSKAGTARSHTTLAAPPVSAFLSTPLPTHPSSSRLREPRLRFSFKAVIIARIPPRLCKLRS